MYTHTHTHTDDTSTGKGLVCVWSIKPKLDKHTFAQSKCFTLDELRNESTLTWETKHYKNEATVIYQMT